MRGIVASGEGAKGAWQAAAIERLVDVNGLPDFMSGVSSGAVNSFAFAHANNPLAVWESITSIRSIFSPNWVSSLWRTGLMNAKPSRKLIERFGEGPARFPYGIPFVNAYTGHIVWAAVAKGEEVGPTLTNCLLAAMAIPGLVEAQLGCYLDAGAAILSPVARALSQGSKLTVVLGRDPFTAPTFTGKGLFLGGRVARVGAYAYRFLDLLMHEIVVRDTISCKDRCAEIIVVYPGRQLPDALAFDQCRDMLDLTKYPMRYTTAHELAGHYANRAV